jgi:membrane-associated phospholipid phosphatase
VPIPSFIRFRRSELLFAAYFLYLIALAFTRPIDHDVRWLTLTLNGALIFWFCLLAIADPPRRGTALGIIRDWLMLPLILLAYREMGWMALPQTSHALEQEWVKWDRLLLNDWGGRAVIESLGPVIPNVLELSYLLVYAVPFISVAYFYINSKNNRLDDFYSVLLFATLTTYALYPFFPSQPPRFLWPDQDLPMLSLLRRLNLFLVNNAGIHTSVFPSGHVAAAFSSAFGLWRFLPEVPWAGRRQMILATLISVATVYGRYHYAVDALAGLGMALIALALSFFWRTSSPTVKRS